MWEILVHVTIFKGFVEPQPKHLCKPEPMVMLQLFFPLRFAGGEMGHISELATTNKILKKGLNKEAEVFLRV